MTQPLSLWLKAALPTLPGAIRSVVRGELLRTIKEFYELSYSLRDTVEVSVLANTAAYVISPPDATTLVVNVMEVYFNGRELRVLKQKPARAQTSTSPTAWYKTGVRTVNLWPTPTEALTNGLSVYLALRPDTSSDAVPDVTFEQHFDAVLDGLLGRMMKNPAKPYSNAVLAQYHLQRFRSQIAMHKGLANKGGVPKGAGWNFNSFGK